MVSPENLEQRAHLIGGTSEFEVTLEDGSTSKLHLLSFPRPMEEKEIGKVERQRNLRGVTQEEWNKLVGKLGEELQTSDFNIALMHTGLRDEYDRFQQTLCYEPRSNKIELVKNWSRAFWGTNFAFLFAEKKSQ